MGRKKGSKLSEEHKRKIGEGNKGKHVSDETRKKITESRIGNKNPNYGKRNEKSSGWKGDNVKYSGLHLWIQGILGKPTRCKHCNTEGKYYDRILNKRIIKVWSIQWASISGKYSRDLTDWINLCSKCHRIYDVNKKKNV